MSARDQPPELATLPAEVTAAATQAAARLVANVHYPSDVLAGVGLGLLAGRFGRR